MCKTEIGICKLTSPLLKIPTRLTFQRASTHGLCVYKYNIFTCSEKKDCNTSICCYKIILLNDLAVELAPYISKK